MLLIRVTVVIPKELETCLKMRKLYDRFSSNQIVSLLTTPSYLYFALAVFFSQVAFNMLNIVLIFLVFHLTSSNFAVAMLLFSVLAPQILISFLGGVVADSGNKKLILVLGNLLRAGVLVVLFFTYQSIFLVYFVTFIISSITQFYVPAESPLIPVLVGKEKLVAANSIFGISFFSSVLIGYVLAGPVTVALGRADTFLALSLLFLLATLCATFIPNRRRAYDSVPLTEEVKRSFIVELKETLAILGKASIVKTAFFLLVFSQIVIFILATLIPGYARTILQVPAEDISIILFAPAALGMLAAGLMLGSVFNKASKEKLMSAGVFLSGAVLFLLPFTSRIFAQGIIQTINSRTPDFLTLNIFNFVLLLAFLAGFANALIFVPSQAVLQDVIPENFRSKIYGLLFSLIGIFSIVPIMVAGGVADILGVGKVLFFLGATILLIGVIREKIVHSVVRFVLSKS